ncbi:hypothetical protein ACHAW6_003009 [Cyclotella cf. meneghiniana]
MASQFTKKPMSSSPVMASLSSSGYGTNTAVTASLSSSNRGRSALPTTLRPQSPGCLHQHLPCMRHHILQPDE